MALPKNKSRKINVNGHNYRYAISISRSVGGSFDFKITIQHEAVNGNKLLLKGLVTRDYWLDFSDLVGEKMKIDKSSYPTITPRHIAFFIKKAINEGWNFLAKGNNYTLMVSNNDL